MVHPVERRARLPAGGMSMGIDRVGPRGFPSTPAEPQAAPQDDGGFASLLPGANAPPSNAASGAAASSAASGAAPSGAASGAAPSGAASGAVSPTLSGVAWLQAGIADALGREARDKQARRHGRAMLQALGAVQLAVLGGDDGQARTALAALACAAEDRHEADDPVLQLILREIGVRAAVELARDEAAKGQFATDVSNP
jgi:hypothetical protein